MAEGLTFEADRLTIQDCVAIANQHHPLLIGASARVDEARGDLVQAGLYKNPRLDSGNPQTIGPTNSSVYSFGVTQEIIRGGKRQLDQAVANEALRGAEWDFVSQQLSVQMTVRARFVSALAAQERVIVLQKLAAAARGSESVSQKLLEAGQVTNTDVIQFRVERRRAESNLRNAELSVNSERQALAAALGQPDLQINSVLGDLELALPTFDNDYELLALTDSNPQLQSARVEISRAIFALRRAQAEPKPNVTVQGGYQYTQSSPHGQGLIGLYMDVPLWDRNQGNIQAASATIRKSAAQRDALRADLVIRLTDALSKYRTAAQTATSYEHGILPDAQESLVLLKSAYAHGQIDLTSLLQAQRVLSEANLEYINAQENRLTAAAELSSLLQWNVFDQPATPDRNVVPAVPTDETDVPPAPGAGK